MGNDYWSVPTDVAFDMLSAPDELTVGQLVDDVESVREFVERPIDEPTAIWHELAHIVGVLRGIEEPDRRSI
ncbi:hypothetical protein [Nakamurella panacisegetis]|uniref:hypothetical protein n=1 Tax=Nakamurella panacisegetis TaxID=1090615 RepID=UPI0012FDF70E|nr:hypothetical protein [Nakamurella panacisegetis]